MSKNIKIAALGIAALGVAALPVAGAWADTIAANTVQKDEIELNIANTCAFTRASENAHTASGDASNTGEWAIGTASDGNRTDKLV